MKKKILPILVLTTIFFTGCKDDDEIADVERLPKSIKGTEANISFQYNANSQLVKVSDRTSDNEYDETLFTYNQDGKLAKFVNASYYNGNVNTITYTVTYLANNQLRVSDDDNEYVLVTLNEKGQALKFNTIEGVTNFSYDAKGNMVKMEDNSTTITASYSNDKGILSSVKSPSWVFMLTDLDLQYYVVNNPLTITEIYQEGGSTETYSQTFTYPKEHVVLGFPTKMMVNTVDGGETFSDIFNIAY